MNYLNGHYLLQISSYLMLFTTLKLSKCQFSQLESPCPNIFEYRFDANNNLFGYIEVPSPNDDSNVIRLEVQLSVGNRVQGPNGHISLARSHTNTVENILYKRPLQYNVHFPQWTRIAPKITQILINKRQVCSGFPISKYLVPVLTTINLQHTLTISVPIGPNFDNRPNVIPRPDDKPIILEPIDLLDIFTPANKFESTTVKVVPKPNLGVDDDLILHPQCGLPTHTNSLLINGNRFARGAHPWLGALFVQNNEGLKFVCGTTLISKKHVVTAGHCIQNRRKRYRPDELWVVLGRENIQRWSNDGAQIVQAESVHLHPDYRFTTADGDIAVVVLSEEAIFSTLVRPACVWTGNTDVRLIIGNEGMVVGWGKDETQAAVTPEPRQLTFPVVSEEDCLRSNAAFGEITSNRTFCAGYRNNSGPCNGDSGGGFLIQVNGRWTLRGIVSMSLSSPDGNCDLNQYVVFSDVAVYKQWLLPFLRN